MDLVRPDVLKQIALRLSVEGSRAVYLAQDRSNGRIFVLSRDAALGLRRLSRAVLSPDPQDRAAARSAGDDATAKQAIGTLQALHTARVQEQTQKKPFNPIFTIVPLIEVGPWQPRLARLARWTGGWVPVIVIALLSLIAIWLGARNDWQVMTAFRNVFSLEALLTFGLIAPVLKIIHELGHVLTATRHGVRVRKAGLFIIGLYPMPFVDCTEADMTARRRHRIAISAAGIVTDVIVGLIAFIAWHLVSGDYLGMILANIFVFSTLNSILFNGNPLIKLDGYYVLTDAIGQRNLATRATLALRAARQWAMSLGTEGRRPRGAGGWALLLYGIASLGYRIYIIAVIAFALLPKYLGAGAAVAAWGGLVMFATPLMRGVPARDPRAKPSLRWRGLLWGAGGLCLLALMLLLVRWPVIVAVPMTLDPDGRYIIAAPGAGTLGQRAQAGWVDTGAPLASLRNEPLADDAANLRMDVALAAQLLASLEGIDPARTLAAREQLDGLNQRLAVLERELAGLSVTAPVAGRLIPAGGRHQGDWLQAGDALATLYPMTGPSVLVGPFPEHNIATATGSGVTAGLRIGRDLYLDLHPEALELREIVAYDRETGARTWQMLALLDEISPADLAGSVATLRLRYDPVPLWRHVEMRWSRIAARFREAQMGDRAGYLD